MRGRLFCNKKIPLSRVYNWEPFRERRLASTIIKLCRRSRLVVSDGETHRSSPPGTERNPAGKACRGWSGSLPHHPHRAVQGKIQTGTTTYARLLRQKGQKREKTSILFALANFLARSLANKAVYHFFAPLSREKRNNLASFSKIYHFLPCQGEVRWGEGFFHPLHLPLGRGRVYQNLQKTNNSIQ